MSLGLAIQILIGAGAVNGALLGGVAVRHGLGAPASRPVLAAGFFLITAAAAVATMSAAGTGAPLWLHAETALTFGSGLALLAAVSGLTGKSVSLTVYGAPAAVGLALALAMDAAPLSLAAAVLVQVVYTATAWGVFSHPVARDAHARRARVRRRAALGFLTAMTAVHAAQAARFVGADAPVADLLVPGVVSFGFLALTAAAFDRARASRPVARLLGATDGDAGLAARLDAAVRRAQAHCDPTLRVDDVARLVGASPNEVSAAISAHLALSFADYMARLRVDHAARLLVDPAERRTSVEAIGLIAGFRSRSAFHAAFKRLKGGSPAAFRREAADQSVP